MGLIGSTIAGCRIERKLGEGGMGAVFLATRERDGRHVAVKFLPPEQARSEPWLKRFLITAEQVGQIRHPNVGKIFSVHGDERMPCIVMEYVKGEPLNERLKRMTVLPQREAIRLGRDMARGLQAAHEAGLVHRDIKPGNILLTPGGKVKIIDFGLGKVLGGGDGMSFAGQVLGTPYYMAPEQWGEHEVDHRCDIFALGSTLYHLATGHLPFKAGSKPMDVAPLIVKGEFAPPRFHNPDLPEELELVLFRMMEVDRTLRYQAMELVADDLNRVLDGRYPNVPRLEEVTRDQPRRRYPLLPGKLFTIGRKGSCSITISDLSISRVHAEIERAGRGYVLRDKESRSGSFVRDSQVREVMLKNNDPVRLGKRTFVFRDGMPDLTSSSIDEPPAEREEVLSVSEPLLRALQSEFDRRVVLHLIEQLAPGTHAMRVQATRRLLSRLTGPEVAQSVARRMTADLEAARARVASRLFVITHERLGDTPRNWLGWWDQVWHRYPTQVGPHLLGYHPQPRFRVRAGRRLKVDLTSGLDFRVGRDAGNDIPIQHGSVSRQHATVLRLHERMAVRDESSRLGTLLNGERIQVAFLDPGDRLHLGKVKLTFDVRYGEGEETYAGAFPVDTHAFDVLVEMGHPCVARALVALLRGAAAMPDRLAAEARMVTEGQAENQARIDAAAMREVTGQVKRAREALPRVLDVADVGDDDGRWREVLASRREKLPPQVLPVGWNLPL
jgi:serine/threonine protein kinase